MIYRELGRSGLQISLLSLGGVKFGRNTQVSYPHNFALPDDAQLRSLLDTAHRLGVNMLDTAPAYGDSEVRIGKLLPSSQDWCICTKVGEEFDGQRSHFNFSAAHCYFSIERSRQRLRREVLDLVLVHSDGNDLEIITHSGIMESLQKCKDQGKIRAFGISLKNIDVLPLVMHRCDVVMLEYALTLEPQQRQAINDALYATSAAGCGILIKKALASGHALTPLNHLRFAAAHPAINSVVVGTLNAQHLHDNVHAVCMNG